MTQEENQSKNYNFKNKQLVKSIKYKENSLTKK